MLGRGRSFRDKRAGSLVRAGEESLELFGKYETTSQTCRIGVRKGRSGTDLRLNGKTLNKLSQLVREVPIQIITPRSHEILERGPEYRRRLLDWGVFHVEHRYNDFSRRYQRALDQRNAALRNAPEQAAVWNKELDVMANLLDRMRAEYVSRLRLLFEDELNYILGIEAGIKVVYKRGWAEGITLGEELETGASSDEKRGFTQRGPHRADLMVTMEGELAARRASRGQPKLIICALILAQTRLIREIIKRSPVILVDDLAAELDQTNRRMLFERLRALHSQVCITSTDRVPFEGYEIDKVFHVEHGLVSE
jgi:DNA replication and repair protein RecF